VSRQSFRIEELCQIVVSIICISSRMHLIHIRNLLCWEQWLTSNQIIIHHINVNIPRDFGTKVPKSSSLMAVSQAAHHGLIHLSNSLAHSTCIGRDLGQGLGVCLDLSLGLVLGRSQAHLPLQPKLSAINCLVLCQSTAHHCIRKIIQSEDSTHSQIVSPE